jgi:hypothetical protein
MSKPETRNQSENSKIKDEKDKFEVKGHNATHA